MNLLRCKSLLRLSNIINCNADCMCKFIGGARHYSSDSEFKSAAPNKFFEKVKRSNFEDDEEHFEVKKPPIQRIIPKRVININKSDKKVTSKLSYKVDKTTFDVDRNFQVKFDHGKKNSYNYNFKKRENNYSKMGNNNNKLMKSTSDDNNSIDECDLLMDTLGVEDYIKDNQDEAQSYVKPKKSSNPYKMNYRMSDNPMYEGQFSSIDGNDEKEEIEIEIKDKKEKTFNKRDYQVHHFDPKLTEFPDETDINEDTETNIRRKTMKSDDGIIEYDLSTDEFDVNKYVKELTNTEPLGPLETCTEDISDFGPGLGPTFNFAAYANKSELIQQYIKLGVKLYKVENDMDHMRALLSVDLKEELPIYIRFLHDCGVPASSLGDVITANPMILKEDLDDMKTRIRYLRAHDFSIESIARIVTKNPTWLTWATKHIDERLGHFQNEFKLSGYEVRFLATKQPKLITYKFKAIHEITFSVREEMGFNKDEIKALLLSKPRLWMTSRKKLLDSFDYLHNEMKLSHLMIVSQADVLTSRKSRLENRHQFLVELKKVQYDPKKPNYISPASVVFGSDVEFCRDVAQTSVDTYNLFLKTR